MFSFTLVLPLLFGSILAYYNTDEILDLPGLKYKINFRQYSGYLNATGGRLLHYWFVESQKDPARDPLVLWLNGGPGCSSLDGLLSELGPFHIQPDGKTLYDNQFSWNKVANVLFLEAPAGVGFSYSASKDYATDDDQTSLDNYQALQYFFKKYPQFRKNDFYITGESYGGIYIPTLSVRVLAGPAKINFKGFAIGNGFLDQNKLGNSVLYFGYEHGLMDGVAWDAMVKSCCKGCSDRKSCNFVSNNSTDCIKAVSRGTDLVLGSGLNIYNIYSDCANSASTKKKSRMQCDHENLVKNFNFIEHLRGSPPCIDSSNITFYLNQQSVRKALHIPPFVQEWEVCSDIVGGQYKRLYNTMKPQILKLLASGKRGLIYNGDIDMACNFLGDEWFVEDLGLEQKTDYAIWQFGGQTAGFYKTYKDLTFLTIRGSGHMVPQDKPGPAVKMISNFLYNKPYKN